MLAQAVSNIPRERSQPKFQGTSNRLCVQTDTRCIAGGEAALSAGLSKNHLLAGLTQKRVCCSPIVSFKDKHKCSPNKINTNQFTFITYWVCNWFGPPAVSSWSSFLDFHPQTAISHPFLTFLFSKRHCVLNSSCFSQRPKRHKSQAYVSQNYVSHLAVFQSKSNSRRPLHLHRFQNTRKPVQCPREEITTITATEINKAVVHVSVK